MNPVLEHVRRRRESGNYAILPTGGEKPFVLADERDCLLHRFKAKPDFTLRELWSEFATAASR